MFTNLPAVLGQGWFSALSPEFETAYMQALDTFLEAERGLGKSIFPSSPDLFRAFQLTPPEQVKVVILGQDPYHGENQAHGLSFSVPAGVKIPPSLRNIFKELHTDLAIDPPEHGCLQGWAEQGVLLLNATLSVEQAQAGSHQGQGWELFTDRVIEHVNHSLDSVVFLLWGSHAQEKGRYIDKTKHCVLTAPHPSPLSAYRGFFGCAHFSKTNAYLKAQKKTPIDWRLF